MYLVQAIFSPHYHIDKHGIRRLAWFEADQQVWHSINSHAYHKQVVIIRRLLRHPRCLHNPQAVRSAHSHGSVSLPRNRIKTTDDIRTVVFSNASRVT